MNTHEAIKKRIAELCQERHMSRYALAHHAGIPKSTIKNIFNGSSKNTGIITIKILCDGLDISLTDFFNTDYFRNLEQEIN